MGIPRSVLFALFTVATITGVALADDADSPAWRHKIEQGINGQGDDPQEFLGKMNDACALSLQAKMDWSGFRVADWQSDMARIGGMCLYDSAGDFHDLCADPEGKKAAATLKTVTCHPTSCDKIPDPKASQYRVTANGAGYDVVYCAGGTHGQGLDALQRGLTLDSPTGRVSEKEALWRRHTQDRANGRDHTSAEDISGEAHDSMKSDCGHDATMAFDWASLPMKDWWVPGADKPNEQTAEWACAETMKNMARACATDKKPLATVTTLVCHGAPIAQLPRGAERGSTGDFPLARFERRGAELHVWFAPDTQLFPETLQRFLASGDAPKKKR